MVVYIAGKAYNREFNFLFLVILLQEGKAREFRKIVPEGAYVVIRSTYPYPGVKYIRIRMENR
jgi:hypothetical protein